LVYIVVEELMHYNIPFPVVAWEVFDVPPVLIEESIPKPEQFRPYIKPAMDKTMEQYQKTDHACDRWLKDSIHEMSYALRVLSNSLEHGDAKCLEHGPYVENGNEEGYYIPQKKADSDVLAPYVSVSINKSRREGVVDESF
jgi:hypothetical protein